AGDEVAFFPPVTGG
ncbi:MoaD/ThiS family protein, partial [Raoultella planticola]